MFRQGFQLKRAHLHRLLLLAVALVAVFAVVCSMARSDAPDPYSGFGAWVDIFDGAALDNPEAAIKRMDKYGVRTLYIETSNSSQSKSIVYPEALSRFIEAAHARGMLVVTWYLPTFKNKKRDLKRSLAAAQFKTTSGQTVDGFALDIESTDIASIKTRNSRTIWLSKQLRKKLGDDYPLGGIIPSPYGIEHTVGYWHDFPYKELAKVYDAFLPMSYSSFHAQGKKQTTAYLEESVQLLQDATAENPKPIHLIGGIADAMNSAEVKAFTAVVLDQKLAGGSLYDYGTSSTSDWKAVKPLAALNP